MRRLIIVGSPRVSGRSAHLAEMLFEANIDEHPEDELFLVPLSEIEVGPCVGCNACREKSQVILKDDTGVEISVAKHRCVFDDDMQTLYDLIDDADEITVVSPVYFSGAPGSLKCLLDRLQPYYWANVGNMANVANTSGAVSAPEEPSTKSKRPATLHVIGEGGDPHGYDALVSEVKSALAVAGFRLERILDWVGKIDESGEIMAEADEKILESTPARRARAATDRPKLDLSSGYKDGEPSTRIGKAASAGGPGGSKPSAKGGSKPKQSAQRSKDVAKKRSRGKSGKSGGPGNSRNPRNSRHE